MITTRQKSRVDPHDMFKRGRRNKIWHHEKPPIYKGKQKEGKKQTMDI